MALLTQSSEFARSSRDQSVMLVVSCRYQPPTVPGVRRASGGGYLPATTVEMSAMGMATTSGGGGYVPPTYNSEHDNDMR